ncbi:MAG: 50S ribosomal protein L13 [Arenicellales bacterium]|jgi:large subunit ribosomal protein L13|nr:50S ribosomal protein L13 [Arenicellales bacterium]MDP7192472.1 50S ribosomal protein L13 [Arenicellales bacterium]
MKTFSAKPESVRRDWYVVDATDKVLGRLATEVARRLRGKHKPEYTPHVDTGDHIIVINAGKVRVTGNKAEAKTYYRHSGYPGGLKEITFARQMEEHPERIIESAVKGMLPKNPLGRAMFTKLRVYAGTEHKHVAQQPKTLEV